jgi:hypothetical protein
MANVDACADLDEVREHFLQVIEALGRFLPLFRRVYSVSD